MKPIIPLCLISISFAVFTEILPEPVFTVNVICTGIIRSAISRIIIFSSAM